MPVQIVPCPTVREADGLAMSSRNVRLTPAERAQAPALYRALSAAGGLAAAGGRDAIVLDRAIRGVLEQAPLGEVDYVEFVRADDLTAVDTLEGDCLIALAVRFGGSATRLIDNVRVSA
jgi:pantoate--beta-alanine ligase